MDVSLREFLSRPVKLLNLSWTPGSDLNASIDLATYLNLIPIKHKLNQFARIRFTQCITVSYAVNPFYSGSLLLSAFPLGAWDEISPARLPLTPINQDFIRLTQRPHVFMSVNKSHTATLRLPWFSTKEWYSLVTDNDSSVNPYTVSLNSLNQLAHCNGGTEAITVNVFMSLEDVELEVPTTYYTASSEQKPISSTLEKFAQTSNVLSRVPFLRPYMTPIQAAASMSTDLAKVLGFSKPFSTRDPAVTCAPSKSQTDQPNSIPVMGLSSANSVSVGKDFNLSDEMLETNINKLAQRYSYLYTVAWTPGSVADTSLLQAAVLPLSQRTNIVGMNIEEHHPAISYLSLPFARWSGSIKYKIQAIASGMHRGRLRITWDPYPTTNVTTPGFYNTVSAVILDLEESHEVELVVPFHSQYYALRLAKKTFPTTLANYDSTMMNGYINITVLNTVTTPNNTTDTPVPINIWIAGGEDYQVYAPCNRIGNATYFPASKSCGNETKVPRPLMVAGECVMDIMTLVKRESPSFAIARVTTATPTLWSFCDFDRPVFRGKKATGTARYITTGPSATSYDYANNNFLTHYELCFAGRRGGYIVRYQPLFSKYNCNVQLKDYDYLSDPTLNMSAFSIDLNTVANVNKTPLLGIYGLGPAATEHETLSGTVAGRKPFYNINAVLPNYKGLTNWGNAGPFNELYGPMHQVTWTAISDVSNFNPTVMVRYVAAAEDYQLLFYCGPPIVYFSSDPNPAL